MDYSRCSNCGSYDLNIVIVSHYNQDLQDYIYLYGITCVNCGKSTPIRYSSVNEAFKAWDLDIDILN